MQQLSGLDASFLYVETPGAPMHVSSLVVYDPSTASGGRLRFKQIIATYRSREHLARCFCQRIVDVPMGLDHPFWVSDEHYDAEFHIRHISLPKPGDWRQLCIQVARLHARPLDRSRPLWEAYVIEGLDNIKGIPKGSFAIFSKVHHAAIDGVSGNEILTAMHDLSPEHSISPAQDNWQADKKQGAISLLRKATVNQLRQPIRFARLAVRTVPTMAKAAWKIQRGELQRSGRAPDTRFNGALSPHRSLTTAAFKLDDFKDMKRELTDRMEDKTTINDLALAVCGGALHHYLSEHEELPDSPLIAMVPITVRKESEAGAAGNHVSAMFVPLGSHLSDPFERLEAVRAGASHAKTLTDTIGTRTLPDYTQQLPSVLTRAAARLDANLGLAKRLAPAFNCVITNVPGPQVPLYMTGAKMVSNFAFLPVMASSSLGHVIGSYCGQLTIGVTACRDSLPDPDFYAECLQRSFDELKAVVMPSRKRRTAKKRGK